MTDVESNGGEGYLGKESEGEERRERKKKKKGEREKNVVRVCFGFENPNLYPK